MDRLISIARHLEKGIEPVAWGTRAPGAVGRQEEVLTVTNVGGQVTVASWTIPRGEELLE
jgi:hypothetical protein